MTTPTNNIPTVFVVFGATGDLMKKKIVPALFDLFRKGELPDKFRVVGFARREWNDADFHAHVKGLLIEHGIGADEPEHLDDFLQLFHYHRGEFADDASYEALERALAEGDRAWGVCANKLFYLAVPPASLEAIITRLASSGLTAPCSPEEGWTRVLVEKPFGDNARTAQALDEMLGKLFKEEQIYRIDHYLAKEMLQNILIFRFANNLFELAWDNRLIESVHARVFERVGVETRGAFYDGLGALRDVGQNHLLQMLALVTMDPPESFASDPVRAKRAEAVRWITTPTREDIQTKTRRAQYTGYREIAGVRPDSQIETYFKVELAMSAPRWSGIPFTIESGKRLGEPVKEIIITFKHPMPCLCPPDAVEHYKNEVVIRMEPREEILIGFWAKHPGFSMASDKQTFNFMLREPATRHQYIEEYERLLIDCIRGDQTLFVSTAEIREMWRVIDPIVEAWKENTVPLEEYEADGTVEA